MPFLLSWEELTLGEFQFWNVYFCALDLGQHKAVPVGPHQLRLNRQQEIKTQLLTLPQCYPGELIRKSWRTLSCKENLTNSTGQPDHFS